MRMFKARVLSRNKFFVRGEMVKGSAITPPGEEGLVSLTEY